MSKFTKICKMSQDELKSFVTRELIDAGYEPIVGDGYVLANGDGATQVLLTAHLDTVHKERVRTIKRSKGTLSSPQGIGGDDRCGVWIILSVIKETNLRPSILFCEDEEIGCVGADKFIKTDDVVHIDNMKFLVELDRMNANDAVFYECDNPDFTDFILKETGYKEAYGSFSDICILSEACGVAAVNLSCGYYKPHTVQEYVVYREMEQTKNVVIKLLQTAQDESVKQFEFIESLYSKNWKYGYQYGDYNYGYSYGGGYNHAPVYGGTARGSELYLMWYDADGNLVDETVFADSEEEAFGRFFIEHSDICFNDIIDFDWY